MSEAIFQFFYNNWGLGILLMVLSPFILGIAIAIVIDLIQLFITGNY